MGVAEIEKELEEWERKISIPVAELKPKVNELRYSSSKGEPSQSEDGRQFIIEVV